MLGGKKAEQMFRGGSNVTKHLISMVGRSPSLQVRRPRPVKTKPKQKAFFPQTRDNQENRHRVPGPISLRPTFKNLRNSQDAQQPGEMRQLERIANTDIEREIKDIPAGPEKTVLQQINRKVRDARFRQNVLTAYGNRCVGQRNAARPRGWQRTSFG